MTALRPTSRAPLLAALLALPALAGCSTGAVPAPGTGPSADLPDPVPGVVQVDGALPALTASATARLAARSSGRDLAVRAGTAPPDAAAGRLCRGAVDVVTTTAPLPLGAAATCRAHRLPVVALPVAADADVLAVASTDDEAPPCLGLDQATRLLAGDDVATWADLDPALPARPVRLAGPGGLDAVAGTAVDREQAAALPVLVAARTRAAALVRTETGWYRTARAELAFARAERQRGLTDGRTARERSRDAARERQAVTELGRARTTWLDVRRDLAAATAAVTAAARSARAVAAVRGTVGRFTAAQLVAAGPALRPIAVRYDGSAACVRPSAASIADGGYPLSRAVTLLTTRRSLARPEVEAYLRFRLETAGDLAVEAALLPLPPEQLVERLERFDDGDLDTLPETREPERPVQ